MEQDNLILLTDSYKVGHHKQYPPGLTKIKAYFESRGGKFPCTVFFGLQYVIKKHLTRRVTQSMIDEADAIFKAHFGRSDVFNRKGWEYIVKKHGGKLPIRIRAVAEGSVVPVKNVLFVVESTDDQVPWIATYVETILVQVWYPMTVATNSYTQKKMMLSFASKTGADPETVKLHDFGYRGCSSHETATIGSMAHLTSFKGTDTLGAIKVVRKYYGPVSIMPAKSIPANEHSTATSWGQKRELDSVHHMLTIFPNGALSLVADSYDIWNFVDNILASQELKSKVENRNGVIVIRPDSGNPVQVVKNLLEKLGAVFGTTINSAGYKVLPNYLRVIQGDGVSYETISQILSKLMSFGWCSSNVTFGSGGGLLQKLDRDTQKCAFKCCMAVVDGRKLDVFKDPVTDPEKKSKKGDITLVRDEGQYKTMRVEEMQPGQVDQLLTVFENGDITHEWTFEEVRQRIEEALALEE